MSEQLFATRSAGTRARSVGQADLADYASVQLFATRVATSGRA